MKAHQKHLFRLELVEVRLVNGTSIGNSKIVSQNLSKNRCSKCLQCDHHKTIRRAITYAPRYAANRLSNTESCSKVSSL